MNSQRSSTGRPDVTLKCQGVLCGIACTPEHDLVAFPASKGVFIYSYEKKGEPPRVFDKHETDIRALVHLSDDLLASVDEAGLLLTWRAGTGDVVDILQLSEDECTSIAKARSTQLLFGAWA